MKLQQRTLCSCQLCYSIQVNSFRSATAKTNCAVTITIIFILHTNLIKFLSLCLSIAVSTFIPPLHDLGDRSIVILAIYLHSLCFSKKRLKIFVFELRKVQNPRPTHFRAEARAGPRLRTSQTFPRGQEHSREQHHRYLLIFAHK